MSTSVGESKNTCLGLRGTVVSGPETRGVVEPEIPIWGLALGKETSVVGGRIMNILGLIISADIALAGLIKTL